MNRFQFIITFLSVWFLTLISVTSFAQSWIYFTGTVTDIDYDLPVADYPVYILLSDSISMITTYTDQEGVYLDSLFIDPVGTESAVTAVFDCEYIEHSYYFYELEEINVADFNICIWYNDDCYAHYVYEPDFFDPYIIYFFNLSYGEFNSVEWDFGDGTASNELNPMHQYNSSGMYEVCLSIEDTAGICEDIFCGLVYVDDSSCFAEFDWYADTNNPLLIHFTDQSYGDIAYWHWDFGDLSYSEEQSPVHLYSNPGQYLVTLEVFDSLELCYDMIAKWIYITDSSSCTADFVVELDTLNNFPNVYHFKDFSTGNANNWLWDFGDGQVSFDQNPIHVYQESGAYEVCLTISSNDGVNNCFDSECKVITTPEYFNFGGQVFMGDYPLNVDENDSSNIAIAYLYRRYLNKWELMDMREFWKFGYYWFADKPEGEYIVRTDLLPGSDEFGNYAPVYYGNASYWIGADILVLDNSEHFAVNINLKPTLEFQGGIGHIDGKLVPGLDCNLDMDIGGELVYLLNSANQIVSFTYTDETAGFSFDGLGFGSYMIKVEIAGKLSQTINVQIDEANTSQSGLLFEVDCNSYVDIKEIVFDGDPIIESIYPQPASQQVYIDLTLKESSSFRAELININGQVVSAWKFHLNAGKQTKKFGLTSMGSGLYLLKISDLDNSNVVTKKIMIKNQ